MIFCSFLIETVLKIKPANGKNQCRDSAGETANCVPIIVKLCVMKEVILYFPDAMNLRAFVLVERLVAVSVDTAKSLFRGKITESQLSKALTTYGAKLYS